MVDMKVGGPATAQSPDAKKRTARPTGGPSFASLLDDTTEAQPLSPTSAPLPTTFVPLNFNDDNPPRERTAKEQAATLLDNLQALAEDVLAGQPTGANAKLEAALQVTLTDEANLSEAAKQALNELTTRAAVAAAKVSKP